MPPTLFALLLCGAVQGFKFGSDYREKDLEHSSPSRIYRAKASMNGYKMVMNVQFAGTQIFDMYNMRVRWTEPAEWNDGQGPGPTEERKYDLKCWITEAEQTKQLFQHKIGSYYQGYNEKFRFPSDLDVYTTCSVRAVNAVGNATKWKLTNSLRVKDIPVYMPGLEGIDLRGLDSDDIASVLAGIAFPDDDEDDAAIADPTTVEPRTTTTTTPEPTTTTTTPEPTTTTLATTQTQPTTTGKTRRPWWLRPKSLSTTTSRAGIGNWWATTLPPAPRRRKLAPGPLGLQRPEAHKPFPPLQALLKRIPLPSLDEEYSRQERRQSRRLRLSQASSHPLGYGYKHFWQ